MDEQRLREMERDFADDDVSVRDYAAHGLALIADVRRLQQKMDALRQWQVNVTSALMEPDSGGLHYADVPTRAKQVRQQRDAALALLREVEWVGADSLPSRCPICDGHDPSDIPTPWHEGHAHDCRLAALIGGTNG